MKKVLLTGASGFIGRHAIPFLIENGYGVHAVFRTAQPSLKKEPGLFWHQCDLLNLLGLYSPPLAAYNAAMSEYLYPVRLRRGSLFFNFLVLTSGSTSVESKSA